MKSNFTMHLYLGWKELKENWCLVKSATSNDPLSTISSSVTALDVDPVEGLSNTQRKRKHNSTESDDLNSNEPEYLCNHFTRSDHKHSTRTSTSGSVIFQHF